MGRCLAVSPYSGHASVRVVDGGRDSLVGEVATSAY